ncbi:MAG: hypothetical protein QF366_01950, partial [Candidatus Poseidoniia archaeon]|nr:hypothetical protein [Candidatus Poseidoniia archaeon]
MRPRPFLLLIAGIALALFYTIPGASADAILNVDGEGFHDYTSFGPVGGTAVFYITVSNDGDADYEDASISASFDDESWTADKVNFDDGTNSGNATLDIGAIGAAESVVLAATVSIPESAENQDTVTFIATVDADGDIATREFTVVVTDWIAYSDDGSQSYEMGDTEEDCSASTSCNIYNITVMNLNEADISNEITIGFAGADEGGWLVGGDDWDEMNLSATLFGLDGNDKYVIELEITVQEGNIPAGDANLAFLAGDDSGYIQPYFIVMNANIAEFFDVRVFGGGSQSVAASGGEVSWEVTIQNMGNTGDNFDISFDTSGLPSGWSTTGTASENTGYLEWKGSGEASIHSFSVTMNVPDGLGAGTSGSFWMSVSSSSGATAADQSFSATVAQGYGLSLASSADEATEAPGG